jgi:hypothetical protein
MTLLAGCFKRIHCITFGAPPVSLLPINKPPAWGHRKSLFLSFVNEGDPVPRADKAYVRSLLDLYTSPAPAGSYVLPSVPVASKLPRPLQRLKLSRPKLTKSSSAPAAPPPIWQMPPCTLSNAGRVVVLRKGNDTADDVLAVTTTDHGLRGVVFGDPVMHMMKVYRRRVEILATKAITGGAWELS